jgi:hypothetical protein
MYFTGIGWVASPKKNKNSRNDIKSTMDQKVYLVTDVGSCSPCMGIIYGIFDSSEAAEKLKRRINAVGTSITGGWSDNEVTIHECSRSILFRGFGKNGNTMSHTQCKKFTQF